MHQPAVLTVLVLEALCYCGAASSAVIVWRLAIIVSNNTSGNDDLCRSLNTTVYYRPRSVSMFGVVSIKQRSLPTPPKTPPYYHTT